MGDNMTKKLFIITLLLLIIYIMIPRGKSLKVKQKNEKTEIRGIFISYIELNNYIKNNSEKISKINIDKIISNIKNNSFNTIYLQVRSHMDSIYDSYLFPVSKNIVLNDGSSYDVLDYFIKKAKQNKISVYAWINPYRIGSTFDKNSVYYKRVKDDIKIVNNTYYLNPASLKVTQLIVEGVEEIVKKYDVDGILFDDYFYPSNDIDFEQYKNDNLDIPIEQYHLNNISNMIYSVNKKIKQMNKNVVFGVSPEGNIDNNYSHNFADVKKWISEEGYVDFLMPQIYYGFDNESKPFIDVIHEWESLAKNTNVVLFAALAFYKTGVIDNYAKGGKNEWVENSDIIKRQVLLLRENSRYQGFSVFRYDNLFNREIQTENTIKELENLKKVM